MKKSLKEMNIFAAQIRKAALRAMNAFHGGHVGGSMSMSDLMAALYGEVMKVDPKNPQWEERDWLVVSKGHCGPAVYGTLALMGYFPEDELDTLNKEGTRLPSHCDRNRTPGIDMTTGSLGQGVSAAVGIAWGMQYQKKPNYVYTILGDGECDEGQVWEGAQFAAHYKLDNLVCFVDFNKRQLDGAVDDIMSHGKGIGAKFDAFGWNVIDVKDGNDVEQIYDAVQQAYATKGKPTCIVLNTVKGKGATFADGTGAHSSQPSKEQWDEAIAYAEKQYAEIKAQ